MSDSGSWSAQQAYPQGSYPQQGYGQSGQGQIPPTNAGWAVAALLFFWPLAFTAFTASSDVVRLWTMGDHAGAQAASERARRMGRISLLIWAILIVAVIVLYLILFAVLIGAARSIDTGP